MAIKYNGNTKTFYLSGKSFAYVFGVNQFGYLQNYHFGKPVDVADDLSYMFVPVERGLAASIPDSAGRHNGLDTMPLEYPFFGGSDMRHGAFLSVSDTGLRQEDLRYKSHKITKDKPSIKGLPSLRRGGQTLIITLASKAVEVKLFYTVYEDCNTIARRTVIKNIGYKNLKLERVASLSLDLPNMNYDMVSLWGKHCGERHIERAPLRKGIQSVYSLRGASSPHFNPFLALCDPNADERQGNVIGISYIYGGNFLMSCECDFVGGTRIYAGFPDFDFGYNIHKGESFETPETALVFSDTGFGGMSRSYHDLYRGYLINPNFASNPRPIVINNWEATYFDFDDDKLCKIVDAAAPLGIDTFVLDDGWFGKRNSDTSGLGDWYVNKNKLHNGLTTIINRCKDKGMKFGLWFEPEMISEDSDLFRTHPEWRMQVPNAKPSPSRSQYVLNLSRQDVVDYLKQTLGDMLRTHDISYVKWDYNRHITDVHCTLLPPEKQQEILHRYMLGFYELVEYLTTTFPHVLFEGCSSGGGRFDPSMLPYFPQHWTSDNSDAWARTFIQYGTSLCYPLSSMAGHVSVCPNHQTGRNTPLESRGIMASLCAFGYELDISQMSDHERAIVKTQIEVYRRDISPLILNGDLYRLKSPFEGNLVNNSFAFLVVSKDKQKALLAYMQGTSECSPAPKTLKLDGLNPRQKYKLSRVHFDPATKNRKPLGGFPSAYTDSFDTIALSGSTLMSCGVPLPSFGWDFGAVMYLVEQV
ncbi:MAG: alpha-galactosidase [Firmicutes bacterium]|nr:alpha-galactosidase [Bacillota bacterium]